jgi:hypothetical protein
MSASGELVKEAKCVTSIYKNSNGHYNYSGAECRLFLPSSKEYEQTSKPILYHENVWRRGGGYLHKIKKIAAAAELPWNYCILFTVSEHYKTVLRCFVRSPSRCTFDTSISVESCFTFTIIIIYFITYGRILGAYVSLFSSPWVRKAQKAYGAKISEARHETYFSSKLDCLPLHSFVLSRTFYCITLRE